MGVLATAAVVKAAEMAVVTVAVVMEEEVREGAVMVAVATGMRNQRRGAPRPN